MNQTITKYYAQKYNLFSVNYLNNLAKNILDSPYLASSQLSESFNGTKGFSIVFKRSGISQVIQQFPFFQPYLEIALKKGCNVFYLNPLILENGNRVEPHIDCSISSYAMIMTIPRLVSVLYVQLPKDLQGGELILQLKGTEVTQTAQIKPEINKLVYFLGSVMHSVNAVKSSQARISLICEQYNLSEERLNSIPEFEIKSENKK
jgi:Rps23 Pro-64 3,4-dihydroxylase Tpa1-like proline 4-hydroxylase